MFFDDQPLGFKGDNSIDFNDCPDEERLKCRRLQSSKDIDRDEVKRQSVRRFRRLIETTSDGNTLREFYREKFRQLENRNLKFEESTSHNHDTKTVQFLENH